MKPRFTITEQHFRAAADVPMEIALDPTVSIPHRLQAAKILQGLFKIVWEDEFYKMDLAELASKGKEKVVYVRYDEDFYGNNAHQIEREKAAQAAKEEAAERAAAGLPVDKDPPSIGQPFTDTSRNDIGSTNPTSSDPPTVPDPPKRPWWQDEDDFNQQHNIHPR